MPLNEETKPHVSEMVSSISVCKKNALRHIEKCVYKSHIFNKCV